MKRLYLFITFLFCLGIVEAQYYYLPYPKIGKNPGELNKDNEYPPNGGLPAGWTTLMTGPQASGNWTAVVNLPITFYFNGALVTKFKASSAFFKSVS